MDKKQFLKSLAGLSLLPFMVNEQSDISKDEIIAELDEKVDEINGKIIEINLTTPSGRAAEIIKYKLELKRIS